MKSQLYENVLQLDSTSFFRVFFLQASNQTKSLFNFLVFLFLATPLLIFINVNPLIVAALCLTFFGLAGDAYNEIIYASKSKGDDSVGIQKSALKLLVEIVKKSPKYAMLNYFMAICILILVFMSYRYADISSIERFILVLLVFFSALLSIMLIWFLRFNRRK